MPPPDLVIVGPVGNTHISGSLARASESLGISCMVIDTAPAFSGPRLPRMMLWHLGGRRPYRLRAFSDRLHRELVANPPRWLIVLGNAPVTADALRNLRSLGMRCINYSTDDPWNPAHRAAWHLEALPIYDAIFSTRRSNMDDFKRLGCVDVRYLPFAYDERLFGPPVNPPPEAPAPETVLFVGGADRDRAAFFSAFLRYGPPPTLVGGYWERYAHTRPLGIGQKTAAELRCLTAGAAVNLCLVRRANRDGHVMRTFEIAALGGCMVVEDTQEHREILGPDGECVVYFRTHEEAAGRVIALLEWPAERQRLSAAVQKRVVSGANTYADRLKTMLADLEALIAVKRAFE